MKMYVFSPYDGSFKVSYLTNGIGSNDRLFINEVKSDVGGVVTQGICAQAARYNLPKIGVEITHKQLVAKAAEYSLTLKSYEDGVGVSSLATALKDGCAITAYSIPTATNVVIGTTLNSQGKYDLTLDVPFGTNVTALVATFTLSSGASAVVGVTAQVSGVTANNFTNPVEYVVTAENAIDHKHYTVTVTVLPE